MLNTFQYKILVALSFHDGTSHIPLDAYVKGIREMAAADAEAIKRFKGSDIPLNNFKKAMIAKLAIDMPIIVPEKVKQ